MSMNQYIAFELGVHIKEDDPQQVPEEAFPWLTAEFLLRVLTDRRSDEEQ